jgi:DNA-directed RNA polymerase
VAVKLERGIVEEDARANPLAALWVGKVTRKIAKQPTMTMPYGAGQFGWRQQIMDALQEDRAGHRQASRSARRIPSWPRATSRA